MNATHNPHWSAIRLLSSVMLAGLIVLLPGCGRASITFTLNPQPRILEQTTVIQDAGAGAAKILMIDIRGLIIDAPQRGFLTPASNPVDELVSRLAKAESDPDVKAVILRINSPGGSVSASDTMYAEVRRFREKTGKPVVVSMGEIAASGGYYLSLAADRIIAQPTTITGSIGVIMPTLNLSRGMKMIGIESRSVKSSSNKDIANPLEPMKDEHYAILQAMVDEFHTRFRTLVLERRTAVNPQHAAYLRDHADEIMDGRVMTGTQALEAGIVDELGNVRDAFEHAKNLAKIERAELVKYHDEGDSPRSVYAMSGFDATEGTTGSHGDVNLLNISPFDGGGFGIYAGARAYYLWTVAAE